MAERCKCNLGVLEEMHDGDGGEEAREVRPEGGPEVVRSRVSGAHVETQHERDKDAGHDDVAEAEHRHLRVVPEQTGAQQVLRKHHCGNQECSFQEISNVNRGI